MAESNWAKNVEIDARRVLKPGTVIDLSNMVRQANREHRQVRAVGGKWSFTDVIATGDVLIDTRSMRGVLAFSEGNQAWGHGIPGAFDRRTEDSSVLPTILRSSVSSSRRKFAHVLAGTNIRELYLALDSPDGYRGDGARIVAPGDDRAGRAPWMLLTKVGLSGQTLAGAISTGSHGGDFNLPPLADSVRAIQLVGYDGTIHWIERSGDRGITDPALITNPFITLGSRENIHYDDDWFNAVIVSVGSLGIIASIVIEVREQFGVSERSIETTWNDIKPLLASGEIFTITRFSASNASQRWIDLHGAVSDRQLRGIGVAINPYRLSDNYSATDSNPNRQCRLSTQAESSRFDGEHAWTDSPHLDFEFMGIVHDFEAGGLPQARDAISRFLNLWSPLAGTGGRYRKSYTVWDPQKVWKEGRFPDKNLFLSQEIAVSTRNGNHVRCVDRMLEVFDELMQERWSQGFGAKFAGAIFLRFTKASTALLGMQTSADPNERFCYIEVLVAKEIDIFGGVHAGHHNMENITEEWLVRFEKVARSFGGRMHWGQLHHLNRAIVEQSYPDTLPIWREVSTRLAADGGTPSSNWFSKRCGLEPNTEVLAATSWGPNRFDIFGYNAKGEVQQLWWAPGWRWSNLRNRFGNNERFVGPLTATSWGNNRIDIFGLGKRGTILQLSWQGTWRWNDLSASFPTIFPETIPLTGLMASTSPGASHIEIFCLGRNGNIWRFWFGSRGWQSKSLGNGFGGNERFVGSLTAVSDGPGRIHLFGLGTRGQVLQLWRNGGTDEEPRWVWSDLSSAFPSTHVKISGPLTASSVGPDLIDIFAQGIKGNLINLCWNRGWTSREVESNFPGKVRKLGMLHEFGETPSTDNHYKYEERNGVKERFVAPISSVASAGSQHVFGFGESGNVLQMWRGNDIHPWNWSDLGNGWIRNPDEIIRALIVDIRMGSDGTDTDPPFRSDPSNVIGFVKLSGGREIAVDFSADISWAPFSHHSGRIELPSGTRLGDIQIMGIRSLTAGPDHAADNWNMNELRVTYVGSSTSGPLLERHGNPIWRFEKNANQEWQAPLHTL